MKKLFFTFATVIFISIIAVSASTKMEKLKLFSLVINKMIVYNDLYPNSKFLEAWNPGDGVAYFNKNMTVGHLDYDLKKWKDVKEYDVDITKNSEGELVNFCFVQRKKDVVTLVGYNSVLGRELSALRYSYHEQSGFKKMTASKFEGICSGLLVVTEPGYRQDMDNHYVWVDNKLDEQKVIDNVLADFNHEDAFPKLEK